MEITWYGHSCFRITERGGTTIVTDPFAESIGLPLPKLKADVVTVSHDAPGHNNIDAVPKVPHVIAGAGEYEIGDVFVIGVPMHRVEGDVAVSNVAYLFEYSRGTALHLGDLSHIPDQSTIQALGEVHVVMVPVGGGKGMTANEAAEVIALIEPSYVIPMHYALPGLAVELDPVEKFLKAVGVSKVQDEETFKMPTGELPEQTQVVILQPQI